jgi:prevent-host-death family protein
MNFERIDMMSALGHSFASISKLKAQPMNIFTEATKSAVYVMKRDEPVGVVVSIDEYERLVKEQHGKD